MAVDKSFVVKNGLEVNSDLIVADASSKRLVLRALRLALLLMFVVELQQQI